MGAALQRVNGLAYEQVVQRDIFGPAGMTGDLRFTHAGGLNNYSSFTAMFPADRSSIVVLCNFNNNNVNGLFNFAMGMRSIMLAR